MPRGHYERKKKVIVWIKKSEQCLNCGKAKGRNPKFCSIACCGEFKKKRVEDMKEFKEYVKPEVPGVTVDPEFNNDLPFGESLTLAEKSYILSSLRVILNGLERTLQDKNTDYSGCAGEFWNFEAASFISGVPIEKGILNRMADKFCRLRNVLTAPPMTKEESVNETISDLIGYAVILHAYRNHLSAVRMGHLADESNGK